MDASSFRLYLSYTFPTVLRKLDIMTYEECYGLILHRYLRIMLCNMAVDQLSREA